MVYINNRPTQRLMNFALAILMAAGIHLSLSAQQPRQQPAAPATVKSADVSDEELGKFVAAFIEVQEMRAELQEEIAAVSDESTALRLQKEAGAKMAETVESKGLEVERFNMLAQSIGTDKDLNARFQKAHETAQKKSGGKE